MIESDTPIDLLDEADKAIANGDNAQARRLLMDARREKQRTLNELTRALDRASVAEHKVNGAMRALNDYPKH